MPLFYVQDSDRPVFVIAADYNAAVDRWRVLLGKENPEANCSDEMPDSVHYLAGDDDILVEGEVSDG